MKEHLESVSEMAVDLEHHSYRSFYGQTCLIQISSRSRHFVLDVLSLHEEIKSLHAIFANPSVLKVMHCAFSDIKWL